ncbi:Hypothetical protein CINCED_3A013892 [Cinara cedri]|uniref:Uncharacterized protein n=1 Tax=Cinara cedri TaxID=506608 RepID=A0A5E4MSF4_9HEMI|nr:Hypothetical protein CINCED_3A013892 [Cinara cedri]
MVFEEVQQDSYKLIEEESYTDKHELSTSFPTYITLGGGKSIQIITDPIVDEEVGLIRPHIHPFHDNFKDILNQITTDTNNFDDNIVKKFTINEKFQHETGVERAFDDDKTRKQ